jgi:hypothetical protein
MRHLGGASLNKPFATFESPNLATVFTFAASALSIYIATSRNLFPQMALHRFAVHANKSFNKKFNLNLYQKM